MFFRANTMTAHPKILAYPFPISSTTTMSILRHRLLHHPQFHVMFFIINLFIIILNILPSPCTNISSANLFFFFTTILLFHYNKNNKNLAQENRLLSVKPLLGWRSFLDLSIMTLQFASSGSHKKGFLVIYVYYTCKNYFKP